ncbi:MAG: MucB/RseB C-terminal domain-containing protein [Gammaproteobacteria bacterium]|nr:MucB/RseB C-terminal domain-containing protein [Gammaproteobacteria bacterium]MCP5136879.1 MucB/RseB C-terminal domain-containing protein [Gammaproteobacteria bacterium]
MRTLLQRMARAMRSLDYRGTFIYRRDEHIDTLQVFHLGSQDEERERLVTLAGQAREIVRNGDDVQCILPDRGKVLVGHQHRLKPFPVALTDNIETLYSLYRFADQSDERIAGRDTRVIAVQPRDGYRYAHRLWIDADSGLLLRSDMLNEAGEPIEQVMFTNVALNAEIAEQDLAPSVDVSDFVMVPDSENLPTAEVRLPVPQLPPGYQLVSRKQRVVGADAVSVEHLIYSDGLSTISVFFDLAPERDDLLEGESSHGAANAFGLYREGAHITVVGEAPKAAIEYIATGFARVAASNP